MTRGVTGKGSASVTKLFKPQFIRSIIFFMVENEVADPIFLVLGKRLG